MHALKRFLLRLAAWPLALVILFEEWGWQPLQRALARLMQSLGLASLEDRIRRLPPYAALTLFAVPTLMLVPVKILALWLIGQGRRTFRLVTAVPDLLAELPGIRRLAGRPMGGWSDAEWPEWESFNYLAATAYERLTGDEDGLSDALLARGHETPCDTAPADPSWDFDDPAEIARRLPRLSALFPARARG